MRLHLPTPDATERLGAALAATRPARAFVYLHGDLGAGKSTLARALLRALGVVGAIRSPTYTLVERYAFDDGGPHGGGDALHLDLYRIGDAGELEFLGLDAADGALWLVEWPERGASALPVPDLAISLAIDGAGRSFAATAGTAEGRAWLDRLSGWPDLQSFPAAT